MEMVEVLIRIPKEEYEELKSNYTWWGKHGDYIKNGIVLPKGHKRLIEDNFEVGPVYDEEGNRVGYNYLTQEELDNALTIVPEDKEM